MHYIDGEGSIIVPKPVRPIIDYKETSLGNKKGAKREFRYGNLHIREYDDNYTVHRDDIDPKEDALGHLLADSQSIWPVAFPRHLLDIKLVKKYIIEAKKKGRIRELLYMMQYWLHVSQVQLQAQFLLILSLTPLEKNRRT